MHTIITSSFLRHLGEAKEVILLCLENVCVDQAFETNQSSRKPHTQLFFCMCDYYNSSQFSWVVITHAILERAEKKGFMITIKETFRGLKYGLQKNTQYFYNCPPTRKLLSFKCSLKNSKIIFFWKLFLKCLFWLVTPNIMRTIFNLAIILWLFVCFAFFLLCYVVVWLKVILAWSNC